jgi:hypothetical protein
MKPVQGLKLNRQSKSGLESEMPVTVLIIYSEFFEYPEKKWDYN